MSRQTNGKKWDRPAIKAEVNRRGMNLTQIAIDAGVHYTKCRRGLAGSSRPGAHLIAEALGIPFDELFADIYPPRTTRRSYPNATNDATNDAAKDRQARSAPDTVVGVV